MCVVNSNLSKIVLTRHFWLTKEQDVGSRMDEVQCNVLVYQNVYILGNLLGNRSPYVGKTDRTLED